MVRNARKRVLADVNSRREVAVMSSEVMQIVLMGRARGHGPMLDVCPAPGCSAITMGGTCVAHDLPVTTEFPRGRPYVAKAPLLAKSLRILGETPAGSPG
jgi:hypothetical protein